MKILMIKVLIAFLFFSGSSFPQSVDSLIAEALVNNPQLKALEMKIKSSEYLSRSVNSMPPPTAGIEFSQINTRETDIWNRALSQNLFISQMFPLGGKLSAMEEAEKQNINIAERDYEVFRNNLIADIKINYYQLWMTEHHIELRENIIKLLNDLLNITEQQYIVNRAGYSDMLLLKSETASNKTDITVLENEAESYIIQLNSLTGRNLDDREIIVQHQWKVDNSAVDSELLREQLFANNPALLKMDNMIRMNELEITANKKELIPDLMIQGMLMRMPQGMILTESAQVHMLDGSAEVEYMYSLMASITLPFAPWSSGKYSYKSESLAAGIKGIEYEKNNMFREISSELETALSKLKSARSRINLLSNEVIPLYKETLEAKISEYQNNLSDLNSIIEIMRMYLMKEEELGEAQADQQMLLAEIKAMTGVIK